MTVNTRSTHAIHLHAVTADADLHGTEARLIQVDPDLVRAYEQLPSALFLIDPAEDRIVHANQAACELCGHPRSRLLGRRTAPLFELKLQPLLRRVLAGDSSGSELSTRLLPRRGPSLPVAIRMRPLQLDGNSLCLLIVFDISRMADELESLGELNERLEQITAIAQLDARTGDDDDHLRRQELILATALRRSLDEGSLEQVWLPLINLGDLRCIGIESLLRGSGPTAGCTVGNLIDVAGRHGLLPELGLTAATLAADGYRQLASHRRGDMIDYFGLNLSAVELLSPSHLDSVLERIDAAGLSISRLVMELSERDLVEHLDAIQPVLQELRRMRIRVAIDGFGSGPSSLCLLRDLPVDLIKIDRSFIWQLDTSPRDNEIVKAMIALAHGLDIQTVGVGVETQAQLKRLRELGCDHAQGFLLGRPQPTSELIGYLRRRSFAASR